MTANTVKENLFIDPIIYSCYLEVFRSSILYFLLYFIRKTAEPFCTQS